MKIKWYEFLIWTGIGALAAFILTLIFNVTGLTRVSSFEEASHGLFYVSDSIWVLIALYCFATPLIEELISDTVSTIWSLNTRKKLQ